MISDEEQGQYLIGEAAVRLIFNREDVTLAGLIVRLEEMLREEAYRFRADVIAESLQWLRSFERPGAQVPPLDRLVRSPLRDALREFGGIDMSQRGTKGEG